MRTILVLWTVLAVAVVPAAAFGMGGFADVPSAQPVLNRASGDVTHKAASAQAFSPAKVGSPLWGGDSVKTGADGKAEVLHAGGAFRLYENSLLVVPSLSDKGGLKAVSQANLNEGSGVFRASPQGLGAGFKVKTPHLVAGVKGTLFTVLTRGNRSRVAVYSGVVEVTDPAGTPSTLTTLYRGQYIEIVDGKGFGAKKGFTPGNPWTDWKGGSEPVLDDRSDLQGSQGSIQSHYEGTEP